jgi:hypothetical protein
MEYLPEIRDYLFNVALNDLSIIRWTTLEEKMKGPNANEYLEALLAYRDSHVATEQAYKEYNDFVMNHPKQWDEEERLYNVARYHKKETTRTHNILSDMLVNSEEYRKMSAGPDTELIYGK